MSGGVIGGHGEKPAVLDTDALTAEQQCGILRRRWHFEDPVAAAALLAAARDWSGLDPVTGARVRATTPFKRFGEIKGPDGGADCVGYFKGLMIDAGLPHAREFLFARRDRDYSPHVVTRVLAYFRGEIAEDPQSQRIAAMFAEIPLGDEPLETIQSVPVIVGDAIVLKDGNGLFHLLTIVDPENLGFTQCVAKLGVSGGRVDDPTYSDHLKGGAMFRARAL